LLVGFDTLDDAGVYLLQDDLALIQTLDFFTPIVDDAYLFGQVAAANALSDVYAMGGKPLTAMNIVCFPNCEDYSILRDIIRGGVDKVKEAGALLVGGHSVDDNEPKYGLAVTGVVHPQKLIRNNGLRAGDILFLTKPLGSGIIATAIKAEMVSVPVVEEAVRWMATLNSAAAEAAVDVGVQCGTDVTGFGLLGHLVEMTEASGVSAEVFADQLYFMREALQCASMGLVPGGAYANRDYLGTRVIIEDNVDGAVKDVAYSPETSGGLLLGVPEDRGNAMAEALTRKGVSYAIVGRAVPTRSYSVVVKGGR
jgi:selenide,water dikinase